MVSFVSRVPVRLALILGLLAFTIAPHFRSPDTPYAARLALVALAGVLLAAEGLPMLATRQPSWLPLGRCGWVIFVPSLLLLADWQGRVWLGLMPSSVHSRARLADLPLGNSASLMAEAASREAVSMTSRLRAKGDEHGNLLVDNLDGGPAFQRPLDNPDRTVDFVLFSPDGQTLVVGDNTRKYQGQDSLITIWDVTPGESGVPPQVRLRHALPGGEEGCYAASFFPDGRTLVVGDGSMTVSLWDTDSGDEIASLDCVPAWCVAASPDGLSFATWNLRGIQVWDRSSLRLLRTMDTRQAVPIVLAYTADPGALIAADREQVWYWKLAPSPVPFLSLVFMMVGIISWIGVSSGPARLAQSASIVHRSLTESDG